MSVPELVAAERPPLEAPQQPHGLHRLTYPFARPHLPAEAPAVGFFTDTTVCIGCKACEVACKEWNLLPADPSPTWKPSYDHTDTLSATSWRHVKLIEDVPETPLPPAALRDGDFDLIALLAEPKDGHWLMMSDSCKHCATAPCNLSCPTGAIVHSEFGSVVIQPDICTGCGACVSACPFGVPAESELDGHSHKCTLCYDRLHDDLTPACAKACPTQSIRFGPLDEMRALARDRLETLHERGIESAHLYGIDDSAQYSALHAFYLLVRPASVYGLPDEPVNPWLSMRGDYVRAVVSVLVAVVAVVLATLMVGG